MSAQSGAAGPHDGPLDAASTPSSRPDPSQSVDDIKRAAHEAGDAVKSAASDLKHRLVDKGADKVDSATDTAGASLHQVADQLKQAAEGLGGQQAWASEAIRRGADGLEKVSGYLANGRFDDFNRDLRTFARTDPALFLAGSVALGFAAARVARVAAHHASDAASPQPDLLPSPDAAMDEPRSFAPAASTPRETT